METKTTSGREYGVVYLGKGAQLILNIYFVISSFADLPAVSVHGRDSGAESDIKNLVTLVSFSHFRHNGGEHCRVFSQRGSRHSPQGRNQREHVRVLPLVSAVSVFPTFVMMIRSRSMSVVILTVASPHELYC